MNQKLNPSSSLNSQLGNSLSSNIKVCKVVSVILDDSHPMFNELGGWNSIGTVFFSPIDTETDTIDSSIKLIDNIAVPLYSNVKQYPLQNELIYTVTLPTIPTNGNEAGSALYYFGSINLLNNPHQNAYITNPNVTNIKFNKVGLPYRNANSKQPVVDLGKNFTENTSIRPLFPIIGDIIFESRHGSSLRFGGSSSPKITQWKSESQDNYFILSGRTRDKAENIPDIEDLNNDNIIAGFSNHRLMIDLPSKNFQSYFVNITSENISNEQLYQTNVEDVSDTVNPTNTQSISNNDNQNTPTEIYESETEGESTLYTEEEQEFVESDYVYVLPEDVVNQRSSVYGESADIQIYNINIVPIKYLNLQQLTAILNNPITAKRYLANINYTLTLYKINTNKRIAHFLSQCMVESANFTIFTEIGPESYFTKYDFRTDLGNTSKGDGSLHKGRGAIQITGKYNQNRFKRDLNIVGISNDAIAKQPYNIISAGWYWNMRAINRIADSDNVSAVRQKVHGSTTDRIADVTRNYSKILRILDARA